MRRLSRRRLLQAAAAAPLASALDAAPGRTAHAARRGAAPKVAVVGAGAFGGWTALHLRRAGAQVTLLDAWGPGHSRASSGGETRVTRALYGADRPYLELAVRSLELWAEEGRRSAQPLYHRTGSLWMFGEDDAYARDALPLMRVKGLACERLSPDEARRRFPQVSFDGVRHVYHEEQAGYLMARQACEVVRDALVREGGAYHQLAVEPGALGAGRMGALRLSDGSALEADAYVFACGPWLGRVLPDVVGARVRATRQDVFFFGTPAGSERYSHERLPVWVDFGERIFYGIPGVERRGFKIADDTRGPDFDPTAGERTPSAEALARVREFLKCRFPELAQAPLVEARVCPYENSPDGHYICDRHPGAENAWIVGGGSGHGFKNGPAFGEHAARRVLGEAPVDPFFALSRLG